MKSLSRYKYLLYLAAVIIVLPLAAYRFALAGTIKRQRQYRAEGRQLKELQTAPKTLNDIALGREIILSGELLRLLSDEAARRRVKIERYTPYQTESRAGLSTMVAEIVVSGAYTSLLKIIDYMETNIKLCTPVSAAFATVTDRTTSRTELKLTLIVQQITEEKWKD